jgi:DNA-binding CsgD family transcriptional regulator
MPTSTRVDLAQLRAIARLLGECRELGDDPVVWRQHFYAGLGRLLGSELVLGGEVAGCLKGPMRMSGGTAWGFEHGFDIRGYQLLGENFAKDPFQSEAWRMQVAQVRENPNRGAVLPVLQAFPEQKWRRTFDYQSICQPMGADACMHSIQRVAGAPESYESIAVCRPPRGRHFDDREAALIGLAHAETARLVGGPLAAWADPSPTALAPRPRQVLRCLLEGDADKQIAARLHLSPHTVNQYTKLIYRHFQVTGRAELLARWIRRGWSSRAAWESTEAVPLFPILAA